jgi:hypothetical protein
VYLGGTNYSFAGESYWPTTGYTNSSALLNVPQPAGGLGAGAAFAYRNSLNTLTAEIQIARGTYSAYTFVGSFGPFTGAHDALLEKNTTYEIGDIVVDYEVINKSSINDVITTVKLSSQANQKSVLGVISSLQDSHVPTTLSTYDTESNSRIIASQFQSVMDSNDVLSINSLGEGCINVCGENGPIEIGDYITTSSIPGKGMKQDDDLMRNYTVAKARESVTFSSPTEVKQIACSYHAG